MNEHVQYEIAMFFWCHDVLQIPSSQPFKNIVHEAFYLHMWNLIRYYGAQNAELEAYKERIRDQILTLEHRVGADNPLRLLTPDMRAVELIRGILPDGSLPQA